jgi:hypothetical protein
MTGWLADEEDRTWKGAVLRNCARLSLVEVSGRTQTAFTNTDVRGQNYTTCTLNTKKECRLFNLDDRSWRLWCRWESNAKIKLRKAVLNLWTGLKWLRTGPNRELWWRQWGIFLFIKARNVLICLVSSVYWKTHQVSNIVHLHGIG